MSSIILNHLIDEFPEETEALYRLSQFIESDWASGSVNRELRPQRLFDIVQPSSQRILVKILSRLIQQGIIQKKLRVESDSLGGIGDFDSIIDIPPVLFDSRIGRDIEVRLDQVSVFYKLQQHVVTS